MQSTYNVRRKEKILTTGPPQHRHFQLSLFANDVHDVFPPSRSPSCQICPDILLLQKLRRARMLRIVDYSSVDTATQMLEEARVQLVRNNRLIWVNQMMRVDREGYRGQGSGMIWLFGERPMALLHKLLDDGHGEYVMVCISKVQRCREEYKGRFLNSPLVDWPGINTGAALSDLTRHSANRDHP